MEIDMTEHCASQEQKLKSLFGAWPTCAQTVIADGLYWEVSDAGNAPDKMLEGSKIKFNIPCKDKSGVTIVKSTLKAATNSAKPKLAEKLVTAWSAIELKFCADYNALTGKLEIPDDEGHIHSHTVTIRVSGANSASSSQPTIVCDYDDDVWNHSGSWKAQH